MTSRPSVMTSRRPCPSATSTVPIGSAATTTGAVPTGTCRFHQCSACGLMTTIVGTLRGRMSRTRTDTTSGALANSRTTAVVSAPGSRAASRAALAWASRWSASYWSAKKVIGSPRLTRTPMASASGRRRALRRLRSARTSRAGGVMAQPNLGRRDHLPRRSRRQGPADPRPRDPPIDRGMRVEKELFEPMRAPLGQVEPGQTLHGADEAVGIAGHAQREVVRAPLDPARVAIRERQRHERDGAEDEREPGHAGGIRDIAELPPRDAGRKRALGDREADQGEHALHRKAAPHVAVDVVTELVREDRFDFARREVEQRVEEQDPSRATEPEDGGVRRPALAGLIGDPHTDRRGADARGQREELRVKTFVREWSEPVEERHDPHRQDHGEDDVDHQEGARAGEPPPPRRRAEQAIDEFETSEREQRGQRRCLRLIREPRGQRLTQQSIAPWEPPASRPRERRDERTVRDAEHARNERDLDPPWPFGERTGEPRGGARPRYDEQIRGAEDEAEHAENELSAMVPSGVVRDGHVCIVSYNEPTFTIPSEEPTCFSQSRRSSSVSAMPSTSPRVASLRWCTSRRAWAARS